MSIDHLPEDREWADEADITFDLPEHVAWEIQRMTKEVHLLRPLFGPPLRDKQYDYS